MQLTYIYRQKTFVATYPCSHTLPESKLQYSSKRPVALATQQKPSSLLTYHATFPLDQILQTGGEVLSRSASKTVRDMHCLR